MQWIQANAGAILYYRGENRALVTHILNGVISIGTGYRDPIPTTNH